MGLRRCGAVLQLTRFLVVEVVQAELVDETERHAGVLKHVVKGEMLHDITLSVDVRVQVLKSRFDDECRRIAGLGGRGMVGAGVAALCHDPRDVAVLGARQQRAWEVSQGRVGQPRL